MHISNQNHQSSAEMINTFGKKNKKESVMDTLMKLGEPIKGGAFVSTKEGKKTKTMFSLEENHGIKSLEKMATTPPFFEHMLPKNQSPMGFTVKAETKTETKIESKNELSLKKTEQTVARSEKANKTTKIHKVETPDVVIMPSVAPIEKPTDSVRIVDRKKESPNDHSFVVAEFSKQTPKKPMTLLDIRQEQQILILKDIAKQLSETTTKESSLSTVETAKAKTTFIQLPLGEVTTPNGKDKQPDKVVEGRKTLEGLVSSVPVQPKETKKTKEFDGIKTDVVSVESKTDYSPRQETMKVETVRDIKNLITQEIEQYIEFKEVNAKKVSVTFQHAELGNVDIQVERKDDKIYILLKVEDGVNKEKMEQTLEQLKQELKEKDIDVEYEVESEGQQKEKRKEEQPLTEKENKRENQGEQEENTLKFDELLEVGF